MNVGPTQFVIGAAGLVVAGLLLPPPWGMVLAGTILLGALAINPAVATGIAGWVESLGKGAQSA